MRNFRKGKKILPLIIISVYALSYATSGCESQSSIDLNLDEWIGNYEFYEFAEPNINMVYTIIIYEDSDVYYADVSINGFQTMKRIRAQLTGNSKSIGLVFDKYLPDNVFESLIPGDVLLTFSNSGSEIITEWIKLQPILSENKVEGFYFDKIE